MKKVLFVATLLVGASSLFSMVRAGVDLGPDGYYDSGYYGGWYGPGVYYGNYYSDYPAYYGWRSRYSYNGPYYWRYNHRGWR